MVVGIVEVDIAIVAEATRISKLMGSDVANDQGDNIGTIHDLMASDDRIAFAILSVGGFLGLGAHLVAVPFDALRITGDEVVFPGATRDELKRLPEFEYR